MFVVVQVRRSLWLTLFSCASAVPGAAAPLTLPSILDSTIRVQVTYVGSMPATNSTSPVAVGDKLLLIDQRGSLYLRDTGGATTTLFVPASAPAGLTLVGAEKILNAAPNKAGDKVYVTFTSTTTPAGTPVSLSPRPNTNAYQVVYSYDFDGATLSNPHPIRSFRVNRTGHTGGGLVVLESGSILMAIGDTGDAFEDGRSYAQDTVSHLSKIMELNPATGSAVILAKGIRNVQRLELAARSGHDYLDFVDIGGNIVEELNSVLISDLLDPTSIENFGWGRNADGLAREGTFYINASGAGTGDAPLGEAGFIQPLAQWGREGLGFFAGSGPVSCSDSFTSVSRLFGDLPTGAVFATQQGNASVPQDVFRVNLIDDMMEAVTLADLPAGGRIPAFSASTTAPLACCSRGPGTTTVWMR